MEKMYSKMLVVLMMLLWASVLSAQNILTISGKIIDPDGQGVPLAFVALYDAASQDSIQSIAITISEQDGEFSISVQSPLEAMLRIRHLVFEPHDVLINLRQDSVLAPIVLMQKANLIEEVAVTATRPRYRFNDDGNMVVAVEQIPGFETSSAFELMRHLPGVIVSGNEGILLYGQDVEIMVDGRRMPFVDIMSLLRSLPAFALRDLELIALKGAEHDGDVNAAIINLITHNQRLEGYFGNVGGGGGTMSDNFPKNHAFFTNAFFMLITKNMAFNTSLNKQYQNIYDFTQEERTYRNHTEKILVKTLSGSQIEQRYSSNSNFTWDIKDGHVLFANLFLTNRPRSEVGTSTHVNNINDTEFHLAVYGNRTNPLVSGNVEYRVGPSSQQFRLNYGYVRSMGTNRQSIDENMLSMFINVDNLESRHTGRFDFQRRFGVQWLTTGVSGTFSHQDNTTIHTTHVTGNSVPPHYQNVDYFANENIFAGYIDFRYNLSNIIRDRVIISGRIGFRREYTALHINNRYATGVSTPKFQNSLPSGQINIRFPSNHFRFTTYFTSSLTRPGYVSFLPGQRYVDRFTYMEGNPLLKPRRNYTIGVMNHYAHYSLSLVVSLSKDVVSNVFVDMGNGVRLITAMNAVDLRRFYSNLSLPFSFFKNKVNGNINCTASIGKYLNERDGFVLPSQTTRPASVQLLGNIHYQWIPDVGFGVNIFYRILSKGLQTTNDPYAALGLGSNVRLLKSKQLTVSLEVQDIFNSTKNSYKGYYDNNLLVSKTYVPSRIFSLSLSYRFFGGKMRRDRIDHEGNEIGRFTQ